ncbi:fructokinase [Novosphingobium endophyticum]|uniref:fructokinase n=1 Tax=Novosphingobium endophyticum TaxID=1955250 RepID=A0A916TSW6_9SPHN|nr:fructokinase [Novosphingobium endophyticum]
MILEHVRIPTGDDAEATMMAVISFFHEAQRRRGRLSALGVGSFGPLSLNPVAVDFGTITATSKPGWSGMDLLTPLRQSLGVPLALDTDVNCAAIAEMLFGAGRGLDSLCYVTIGTGVGVGAIVNGVPFGGNNHLEAGHMLLRRARLDVDFAGICPFHGDCAEGLASGHAMHARWGRPAEELPADHPGWEIEAEYVATICANLTYSLRPERIVLGGGVMEYPGIVERVAQRYPQVIAGYDREASMRDARNYITRPGMGSRAGIYGALVSAHRAAHGAWPTDWVISRD